ncbi:MAG: TIGR00725 family protein, partial [Candidatus Altiarchaeota archaeon]|nr:TIGR00725 family protein [Candidatus Altiarchaeota archaeon]
GLTVGILPSLDGKDANNYLDVVITTGLGYARNSIVVSSADSVIAVNGSTGTLSEIAMALSFGKKVVVIKESGGISAEINECLKGDGKIKDIITASKDDAVKKAIQ